MSKVRSKDVVATQAEAEFMDDIARAFDLRKYQKACALVEASLEDHSWSEVVSLLKRIPFRLIERRYYRKREIPPWMLLRYSVTAVDVGKMRDGLLSILGLERVIGIDVDLLKTFGRFRVRNLKELRRKVARKARRVLREQISRDNTFFLDTRQMRPLRALVPRIKRSRGEEFMALGEKPSISRAVRTYYGFAHLTGSLTDEDRAELGKLCEKSPEFSGEKPSYKRHQFKNCSEELGELLVAYLKATNARPQTQVKGVRSLGVTADSRGLGALHAALRMASKYRGSVDLMNPVKYEIIWALGEIGHPSSVEHLRPFVGDFTFDQMVMHSLAHIDHPKALEILIDRAYNEPPLRIKRGKGRTSEKDLCTQSKVIGYIRKFRNEQAITALEDLKSWGLCKR
ncbi:MAG: HEAT repeat domain-containing protein [Candidatus Thorarchaeota archaeon]